MGARQPYHYGVVPYLTPIQLAKLHAPVVSRFTHLLGHPVSFVTAASFESFAMRLKQRRFDIAFIQPYDYPAAVGELGYIPVARMGDQHRALIVLPPDSPLREVAQLKGRTVALPPVSTPACYLAAVMLREAGLDPQRDVTLRHYKSHESCLQQVLSGSAAACVTPEHALRAFTSRIGITLRVLKESPPSLGPLFVAHPDLPPAARQALQEDILSWADRADGRTILHALGFKTFVPVSTADKEAYTRVAPCSSDPV
jgi:phosphonate transport system substrate-binding protein